MHARTSSIPAAVRPGPVSGDPGNSKGTPSANAFGRDQTSPTDAAHARTAGQIGEIGRERVGSLEMDDRGHATFLEVVDRGGTRHRQSAEHVEELPGDAGGLLEGEWLDQRHGVRDLHRIRLLRRRDVEGEETTHEPGRQGRVEVEMLRGLAAPDAQDEVVVAVDDHSHGLGRPFPARQQSGAHASGPAGKRPSARRGTLPVSRS